MLNLIDFGFEGVVYPVGPSGGVITSRRIYESVSDIPDQLDMAVILVPARFVPQVLEECGQKGIRRAVIETAGFREYSWGHIWGHLYFNKEHNNFNISILFRLFGGTHHHHFYWVYSGHMVYILFRTHG